MMVNYAMAELATSPAERARAASLGRGRHGGRAGLAKHLRLRLEALLPSSLGALARGLAEAREALRGRWSDPAKRRRALDGALAQGGPLDPFGPDEAEERVERWLACDPAAASTRRGEINLVSDDPDDLTLPRRGCWDVTPFCTIQCPCECAARQGRCVDGRSMAVSPAGAW